MKATPGNLSVPFRAIRRGGLFIVAVLAILHMYTRLTRETSPLLNVDFSLYRPSCPIQEASRLWPARLGDPALQPDRRTMAQPISRCDVVKLGHQDYGYWHVCESDALRQGHALVFSFGLGEDTSFDEAVIEQFQAVVHGFDPIPRSIKYVANRQQQLPECFFGLHNYAIEAQNTQLSLYPPVNPNHISHNQNQRAGVKPLIAPAISLKTAMTMLGVDYMHILKLDVEGAEFKIFETLLEEIENGASTYDAFPTDQLLVEFHPKKEGENTFARMNNVVDRLIKVAGFKLAHRTPLHEYSFYRPASL
jgi:FkbM family methyltransferase